MVRQNYIKLHISNTENQKKLDNYSKFQIEMPKIFALLVAIDEYPKSVTSLNGCVNDLNSFQNHLKKWASALGMGFYPKTIKNHHATYQNILDSFSYFDQAEAGDTCLFYYSGHGSYCTMPEPYKQYTPNGRFETIVCYDSREEKGRDLLDKELRHLIWKATTLENGSDKKIHFLTITDCCHSGRISRIPNIDEKFIDPPLNKGAYPDFHGHEFYKSDTITPPIGRFLHLSACRPEETAIEVFIEQEKRGIFTFCLEKVIEEHGLFQNYFELLHRVKLRVRNILGTQWQQTPQLDARDAIDKSSLYLSGIHSKGELKFTLAYTQDLGWIVNAGLIHGIPPTTDTQNTTFKIIGEKINVIVSQTLPHCCQIEEIDGLDKNRTYPLKILKLGIPKMVFGLDINGNAKGIEELMSTYQKSMPDLFEIKHLKEESNLTVKVNYDQYYLAGKESNLPLFKGVKYYNNLSAQKFLDQLETIAKWYQVFNLTNPTSSLSHNDFSLEFFQVTQPGDTSDSAPTSQISWESPPPFYYLLKDGKWFFPSFKLKIKNIGKNAFWVSALYLGDDYSITNQLLQIECLPPFPEGEVWLQQIINTYPNRTISVQLDDYQRSQNIFSTTEYIKLIICTEEFQSDVFNQNGLPRPGNDRSIKALVKKDRQSLKPIDWTTILIPIHIKLPFPEMADLEDYHFK